MSDNMLKVTCYRLCCKKNSLRNLLKGLIAMYNYKCCLLQANDIRAMNMYHSELQISARNTKSVITHLKIVKNALQKYETGRKIIYLLQNLAYWGTHLGVQCSAQLIVYNTCQTLKWHP